MRSDARKRLAEERPCCDAAAAKLVRVEALIATWLADDMESLDTWGQHLMGGAVLSCAEHLRAALDGGS